MKKPDQMSLVAVAFGYLAWCMRLRGRRLNAEYLRSTQRQFPPGWVRERKDGSVATCPPRDPYGSRRDRRAAEGRVYSSLQHREWRETLAVLRSKETL